MQQGCSRCCAWAQHGCVADSQSLCESCRWHRANQAQSSWQKPCLHSRLVLITRDCHPRLLAGHSAVAEILEGSSQDLQVCMSLQHGISTCQ
jgi:hypothetical protein